VVLTSEIASFQQTATYMVIIKIKLRKFSCLEKGRKLLC